MVMSVQANRRLPMPIRDEVRRFALLERMSDPLVRYVLLTASSGYGKTTLLAQFGREFRGAVVWVALEEDVFDAASLGRVVVEAVQNEHPEFRAPAWVQAVREGYGELRQARLLAEAVNRLTGVICVVFDQLHLLGEHLHRWLDGFLKPLRPQIRVLLSHYRLANPTLMTLARSSATLHLTEDDLAFTADEQRAFLRHHESSDIDSADGYPLALALRTSALRGGGAGPIFRYLVDGLPPKVREGLWRLAPLPVWDDRVLNDPHFGVSRTMLDTVVVAGLPVRQNAEGAYLPHTLLSQALLEQLESEPLELRRTAHRGAMHWFENSGLLYQAAKSAQNSGDLSQAFEYLQTQVLNFMGRVDYRAARQAIEGFRPNDLPLELRVRYAQVLLETGSPDEGAMRLTELYRQHPTDALVAFAAALLEQRRSAFERALERLDSVDAGHMDEALSGRFVLARAESLVALGRHNEARALLLEASALCERVGNIHTAWHQELLGVCYATIDVTASARCFLRALQIYVHFRIFKRVLFAFNRLFETYRFERDGITNVTCLNLMLEQHEEDDLVRARALQLLARDRPDMVDHRRLGRLERVLGVGTPRSTLVEVSAPDPFEPIFELFDAYFRPKVRIELIEGTALTVRINDEVYRSSLHKSFELLVYLLLCGRVTKKQIVSDVFDGKAHTSANYFKVAMARLRTDLEGAGLPRDTIVFVDGFYGFGGAVQCVVRRDEGVDYGRILGFVEATFQSEWINEHYLRKGLSTVESPGGTVAHSDDRVGRVIRTSK
jgi:tetratricopeptide (TPR) repeat protein